MGIKVKIIGIIILTLAMIITGLAISNSVKDKKVKALEAKLEIAMGEINNLKVKEKVNVAASNSKEKFETATHTVGAEGRANLNYVPDSAILVQLQSDPF